MRRHFNHMRRAAMVLALLAWAASAAAVAHESKRLMRAKDLMADEAWLTAIKELRAAVDEPKESRRDEALYWLAHSLKQAGDMKAAVETVSRLESEFPQSIWVKP